MLKNSKKISESRRQFTIKNELNNCTNFLEFNLNEFSFNLFFLLVTQVDSRNDNEFYTYDITVKELEKLFNKNRIKKETVEKSIKELLNIKIYQKIDKRQTYANLFSLFTFDNNVLQVRIDSSLLPFFTNITTTTPFMKGYFDEFVKLKSSYAKRLYLIMRQNLNKTYSTKYSVENLFIEIFGLKEEEFKSINRRILTPSIKDINDNTSLNIDCDFIKVNKKVSGLNFKISESKKVENMISKSEKINKEIIEWCDSENIEFKDNVIISNMRNWIDDVSESDKDINNDLLKIEYIE